MNRSIRLSLMTLVAAAIGFASALCIRPAVAADEKKAGASFDVYKDKGGEFRWRLRTTNTQVIATCGQGFSSKQACTSSIDSVKKNAADAPIVEKEAE